MAVFHPCLNDHGQKVFIKQPSTATALSTWSNSAAVATVLPDGPMPAELAGLPFASLASLPGDAAGWGRLAAAGAAFDEPVLVAPAGPKPAVGAVLLEKDGCVWLVFQTNAFGCYVNTFPKGKMKGKLSLRATAIKEAQEESGPVVELTGFLLGAVDLVDAVLLGASVAPRRRPAGKPKRCTPCRAPSFRCSWLPPRTRRGLNSSRRGRACRADAGILANLRDFVSAARRFAFLGPANLVASLRRCYRCLILLDFVAS